jgi:hypothetical protein
MRLTRIDVRSDDRRRVAVLTRDGANVIAVIRENCEVVGNAHIVGHTQEENLFELARIVQHALDGYTGTNSMIHDYYRLLQRLAN